MKIARIPLKQYSRFHFGELKLDHDLALTDTSVYAHSDTLFSALVNAYSRIKEQADDFVDSFRTNQISISSLLLYAENKQSGNTVYFLPKPAFLAINIPKDKDRTHKKKNRIKFVSIGVWKNGFQTEHWFDETQYQVLQDNTFVMTKSEFDALDIDASTVLVRTTIRPKSPIRAEEDQAIYYQADIEIVGNENTKIGWYFCYEAEGENELQLKLATNVMAYTGIGGEIYNTGRTIASNPEFKNIPFEVPEGNHQYSNIGLLNPTKEEFTQVEYYSSTLRGGRLIGRSGTFAEVVRMIEEGALLTSNEIKGRLVPLGEDEQERTILRYGKPFIIPMPYDN